MRFLIFIGMIVFGLSACDRFRIRNSGNCLKSNSYGGPYQVVEGRGSEISVRELKSKKEKTFPNDNTWYDVPCERISPE